MSEEQNVLNTLTFNFSVQALDGEVLTSPTYRLTINVRFGDSVGLLQLGYYVTVNNNVYFVVKQCINVVTVDEAEKVFAFLNKTQAPFTISVRRDKTNSGYQYIKMFDINTDSYLYTLKSFQAFRGLWRTIEGELFENKYSPAMVRFSGEKLDWYVKLTRAYPLQFTQATTVSITQVATQGHLQVFKMPQLYTLPYYIYSQRKKVTFFNHSIEGDMYVIPLGPEMRIVHLREEAQIVSPDHDPVLLPAGEYLLIHPRPRDRVD